MLVLALGPASTADFLLQVAALVTGGGIVQLTIFLLRRRSELQKMDRESAAPLLKESTGMLAEHRAWAKEQIDRLQEAEQRGTARIKALQEQLEHERKGFQDQLDRAHEENKRLSRELARLRTDQDIALRQIEELRLQLGRRV